jgi:predicted HTH transcriptional regulator
MSSSKTGWSSLNVVIFPPVMHLVMDDPKVTTPAIPDKINELILEDRQISAKSTAEKLGISRERVESIINEDLDMRKLSEKWVP